MIFSISLILRIFYQLQTKESLSSKKVDFLTLLVQT